MTCSLPKQIAVLLLAGLLPFLGSSQSITYQNPENLFVCDQTSFEITVSNSTNEVLENATVAVSFPTASGNICGLEYVAGSVNNAEEADISNLEMPIFQLMDLAPSETQVFQLNISAPCATLDCINNAELFVVEITLTHNAGLSTIFTIPFIIETPLLIITNVANSVMSGSQGDVLIRTITIQNTRPGPLSEFIFTDINQGGLLINSSIGTDISQNAANFQLSFDGDDFINMGNGNDLFEFGESLIIDEVIEIVDCGDDLMSTVSNLSVGWGCNNEICQQQTINAAIQIGISDLIPDLIFEPISNTGECFCGPDAVPQGMKITNTGTGSAIDILIYLDQIFPAGGMELASFQMDSAGQNVPLNTLVLGSFGGTGICDIPGGLAATLNVQIPELAAGEMVTVWWDLYYCDQECIKGNNVWEYSYNYYKQCPPDPFFELGDTIGVIKNGIPMDVLLNADTLVLLDGESNTIYYQLGYENLSAEEGELTLDIGLPCGINWDNDNELILNGQAPTNMSFLQNDSIFVITASYDLPLSVDTAATSFGISYNCEEVCLLDLTCEHSLLTTCEEYLDCIVPLFLGQNIEITTSINYCEPFPNTCGLQNCNFLNLAQNCMADSMCVDTIPGYVDTELEVKRINFGLPDNDNNRLPDATGDIDLSLVNQKRAMSGDTLRANLKGIVIVDSPDTTFEQAIINLRISGADIGAVNLPFLTEEGLSQLRSDIRIYDASENIWYDCFDFVPTVSVLPLVYSYDLSLSEIIGCGLPSSFVYENGDSILLEADFRINFNLELAPTTTFPLMTFLRFVPDVYIFNDPNKLFTCNCSSEEIEVTGYHYNIAPGIFPVPPCEESQFSGGSLFQIDLQEPNFFPFEYRNLMTLENWQLQMPNFMQPVESVLAFLRYQQSTNDIVTNEPISYIFDNDHYVFDLTAFQMPPLDEGFLALFKYRFEADCDILGSYPLTLTGIADFNDQFLEAEDPLAINAESNALRALVPNLILDIGDCDITALSNQLAIDFNLVNFQTIISSSQSGVAENVWFHADIPAGTLENVALINQITGESFTPINGLFQLDDIPGGDTIPYLLSAINTSCAPVEIPVRYGWNCDPYTNPFQESCSENGKLFTITSPPGEIDMFVENETNCSELCDTIPFHTIEIFNAQLGAVYELKLTGRLPNGLEIVSGSSAIEYPTGSGVFQIIPDPIDLGSGEYLWDISAAVDSIGINGLASVASAPFNSVSLRFLTESTCDFISNSFLIFTAEAEQVCGIPTNSISKLGEPVCIQDIEAPYTSSINIMQVPEIGCDDEAEFTVSITASGDTELGDEIIVNLPQGLNYVAGSCENIASLICDDPIIENNQIIWQLPENVLAGTAMSFSFHLNGFDSLDCGNGFILFQTAAQTLGLCAALGDTCSTKVSTGTFAFPYQIQRPEYSLSDFTAIASPNGLNDIINYEITVTNTGSPTNQTTIVDFYVDSDGDGIGDILVYTDFYAQNINTDETITLSGNFEVLQGTLCNLIAVVDPTKHCACLTDELFLQTPITYQTGQHPVLCSDEIHEIGVTPMPGYSYQWQPADNLDCETCALTNFSFTNNTDAPITLDYELVCTDNMGCIIQNQISVTIQPEPGILSAETPICIGDATTLIATEGATYNWTGEGISNPNLQVQTVMPLATTMYSVMITDTAGCQGLDTITIFVNPLPIVDAGADTTFCPGDTPQLNATFNPDYTYLWSAGPPLLNNPTIHNPIILIENDTILILNTNNLDGCLTQDSIAITFDEAPVLPIPPDVTICLGASTVLAISGADFYEWTPAGNCQNPDCSNLEVSPTVTTTYTVTGTNLSGCSETASIIVTVENDIITTTGTPINACIGEAVMVFDSTVLLSGIYCDTITLPSSCDSVHCINVTFHPPFDTTFFETRCEGDSVIFEGGVYFETGNYCEIFQTQFGCDSTRCLDLTILDAPNPTSSDDVSILIGASTTITVAEGFETYEWLSPDGPLAECINNPNCTVSPSETTTYTIIVTDANGCSSSALVVVTVVNDCEPAEVEIPTAFSPNGDDTNETFGIVAPEDALEQVLSIEVWSRWGEKVFEGSGNNARWNGNYKGKPMPTDVFVYLITVGCLFGDEEFEFVGDVTLLR